MTMLVVDALAALVEVEQAMAVYYRWLAEVFEGDPDARACFRELADQEQSHATQISLQHRMVRSAKLTDEVELERAKIEAVRTSIARFREQNPEPPLSHAVLFAARLESGEIEQAYRNLLNTSSPQLAGFVKGMIRADEKHAEKLRELMAKKKVG
ncbi:MAG: ferritin family protein [Deltaproteobacteria bacterium]|nr:ferritin family protein [Deltaproteobacteria bacterium]